MIYYLKGSIELLWYALINKNSIYYYATCTLNKIIYAFWGLSVEKTISKGISFSLNDIITYLYQNTLLKKQMNLINHIAIYKAFILNSLAKSLMNNLNLNIINKCNLCLRKFLFKLSKLFSIIIVVFLNVHKILKLINLKHYWNKIYSFTFD